MCTLKYHHRVCATNGQVTKGSATTLKMIQKLATKTELKLATKIVSDVLSWD